MVVEQIDVFTKKLRPFVFQLTRYFLVNCANRENVARVRKWVSVWVRRWMSVWVRRWVGEEGVWKRVQKNPVGDGVAMDINRASSAEKKCDKVFVNAVPRCLEWGHFFASSKTLIVD